jgi:2-aminoethylphosphonate transport system permease protein
VLLPVAAIGIGVVYPLVLMAGASLTDPTTGAFTWDAWSRILTNPVFLAATWTTIRIAVISTALCLVVGSFIAFAIVFTPFPGSKILSRGIEIFLSFPSFLIVLALMFILGSQGMVAGLLNDVTGGHGPDITLLQTEWGVIMAEVIYFTPFVCGPLIAALTQVDTAQIGVAQALGAGVWRITARVIAPEVMPALLAGGALTLVQTMNEFGVVLFTGAKGVNTLPLIVYTQAISLGHFDTAAVVAVVNIVLSLVLYTVYRQLAARTLGGHRAR